MLPGWVVARTIKILNSLNDFLTWAHITKLIIIHFLTNYIDFRPVYHKLCTILLCVLLGISSPNVGYTAPPPPPPFHSIREKISKPDTVLCYIIFVHVLSFDRAQNTTVLRLTCLLLTEELTNRNVWQLRNSYIVYEI